MKRDPDCDEPFACVSNGTIILQLKNTYTDSGYALGFAKICGTCFSVKCDHKSNPDKIIDVKKNHCICCSIKNINWLSLWPQNIAFWIYALFRLANLCDLFNTKLTKSARENPYCMKKKEIAHNVQSDIIIKKNYINSFYSGNIHIYIYIYRHSAHIWNFVIQFNTFLKA